MKVSKRLALSAVAVAGIAVAVPAAMADPNHGTGGTNTVACGDGTVTYTPDTVWPPNHRMQTIQISYQAPAGPTDAGDTTSITVGAITDDQAAADGTGELQGSGNPNEGLDWAGTGNTASSNEGDTATTSAQVRAERSGTDQTGRTYDIKVTCDESGPMGAPSTDPNGMQTVDLLVTVPHDQGQHNG